MERDSVHLLFNLVVCRESMTAIQQGSQGCTEQELNVQGVYDCNPTRQSRLHWTGAECAGSLWLQSNKAVKAALNRSWMCRESMTAIQQGSQGCTEQELNVQGVYDCNPTRQLRLHWTGAECAGSLWLQSNKAVKAALNRSWMCRESMTAIQQGS